MQAIDEDLQAENGGVRIVGVDSKGGLACLQRFLIVPERAERFGLEVKCPLLTEKRGEDLLRDTHHYFGLAAVKVRLGIMIEIQGGPGVRT